jgi:D-alanyl-D-alanine carboxypeptidase/D-alanyl-D-alanine-endopeptidase (penicillin-binding protein 4)
MRRYVIFTAILFTFCAHSQNKVQDKLNQLVKNSQLENATVAFFAIDLETNDTIAKWNHKTSQAAASNAKLFSTYTALELLGAEYKPKTRFYIDGKIDSMGVLNGNLWIRGGCDMSLGSKYFTNDGLEMEFLNTWTDTLAKIGIKKINGNIIADGSEFGYDGSPDGWAWSDHGNTYGAPPSGICFYDNIMNYHFKTGAAGTTSTLLKTFPEFPNMDFHNYIKASSSSGDNAYLYGGPYSRDRFGKGTIPSNQSNFVVKSSMPDPEFQLAILFKSYLERRGINSLNAKSVRNDDLKTPNYSSLKNIYTFYGVPLLEIIKKTNIHSVNLFAESLINIIGYEKTGDGSTDNGLNQLESFWSKKINCKGLFIKDGSGLSRNNAMSPSHYVEMLKYIYKSKYYSIFLNTLPVAGISGTLAKVCSGEDGHGRIKAKSGTLTRVKAYSGYVESKSGKKIAFSMSIHNFTCSRNEIVPLMEPVLNAMATH